jgi:IclR family KDG regulon transcriptional repressor
MEKVLGVSDPDSIQGVVFALHILEYLAKQRDAIGVTDLARAFDTSKSRVYRHLRTLVNEGYLVQEPESEKYRVGTRLITLGHTVLASFDLSKMANGVMRNLRDRLERSVVLSQPESDGVRVLAVVAGTSLIEIVVRPGSLMGFHYSAQGKVALAFGSEEIRTHVLGAPLDRRTPKTIVSASALKKEIEVIRQRGWAVAPDEAVMGLNTLAAPIFDSTGNLAGTLGIVDSVQFIADQPSPDQIRQVLEAAQQISQNLGYKKDD